MSLIRTPHTATVKRQVFGGAETRERYPNGLQTIATVACNIEPLGYARQQAIFGSVGGSRWIMTWTSGQFQDNDLVEWDGRIFQLQLNQEDTHRTVGMIPAYQTGYLQEKRFPRAVDPTP